MFQVGSIATRSRALRKYVPKRSPHQQYILGYRSVVSRGQQPLHTLDRLRRLCSRSQRLHISGRRHHRRQKHCHMWRVVVQVARRS